MAIIGTSFFNGILSEFTQQYGWSESHILMQASTLPQGITDLTALARARVQLLGAGVVNVYNRVSSTLVRNDSQIIDGISPTIIQIPIAGAPSPGTQSMPIYNRRFENVCDLPGQGVMCRVEANDPNFIVRRTLWLLGNPDFTNIITNSPLDDGNYSRAFGTWSRRLTNGKYGMMGIDRSPGNPARPINAVTQGDPGTITVPGNTATLGQTVILTGVRGGQGATANGSFVVSNVAGNVLTLAGFKGLAGYTGTGTCRVKLRVPIAYSSVVFRRYGQHRVGRPWDLARGRGRPCASR